MNYCIIFFCVALFGFGTNGPERKQTLTTNTMNAKTTKLQAVLDDAVDQKKVFGASFAIRHNDEIWHGTAGNISEHQQYFIASTTKLFTTAIVLHLRAQGRLQLDDPIARYLDDGLLDGLHVYKGYNYTPTITIRHLLAHTSGLPDYFQGKGPDGRSLEDEITGGSDQSWSFSQLLERSKAMSPLFPPGAKGKAHYSDTNFRLLGKVIEQITQKTFAAACEELIIQPLGLANTYLYEDPADDRPKTIFYKNRELPIPKAMASFGCDGGMVSTSHDLLVFIEAFFEGKLFPKAYIRELQEWNKIFFPMQSGVGIHRFKLPWYFNPTGSIPDLIGHSGLSGALAFYSPRENLYIVGTVNQIYYPDQSFKTAVKLIQEVLE